MDHVLVPRRIQPYRAAAPHRAGAGPPGLVRAAPAAAMPAAGLFAEHDDLLQVDAAERLRAVDDPSKPQLPEQNVPRARPALCVRACLWDHQAQHPAAAVQQLDRALDEHHRRVDRSAAPDGLERPRHPDRAAAAHRVVRRVSDYHVEPPVREPGHIQRAEGFQLAPAEPPAAGLAPGHKRVAHQYAGLGHRAPRPARGHCL